jgi:hypothetical protein
MSKPLRDGEVRVLPERVHRLVIVVLLPVRVGCAVLAPDTMTPRGVARLEIDLVLTRRLVGPVVAKHARMPQRHAGVLSADQGDCRWKAGSTY